MESCRARWSPGRTPETRPPGIRAVLSQHPCQGLGNRRSPPAMDDAIMKVLHEKEDRTDCNTCRGVSLVAHAGNILLKIVASRLSNYCETEELLPEEQGGFPPRTINDWYVVRRAPVPRAQRTEENPPVRVLCRPEENLRLCRPSAVLGGTHTVWRTNQDAENYL